MRDRDTIHHELDHAQADLEASLASLKDAVRFEVDPKRNAERALHFASTEVRGVLSRAWAELVALLAEVWHRLRAVTRSVVAGAM